MFMRLSPTCLACVSRTCFVVASCYTCCPFPLAIPPVKSRFSGLVRLRRRVGRLQINLVTRGIDILLLCALAALPVTTPAQQRLLVLVWLIFKPSDECPYLYHRFVCLLLFILTEKILTLCKIQLSLKRPIRATGEGF